MTHRRSLDLFQLRRQTGLCQHDFWKQVGVTQSTGCRYESGQTVPEPVLILVKLVYVEKLPLAKLNRMDLAIGALMREEFGVLYERLKTGLLEQRTDL